MECLSVSRMFVSIVPCIKNRDTRADVVSPPLLRVLDDIAGYDTTMGHTGDAYKPALADAEVRT